MLWDAPERSRRPPGLDISKLQFVGRLMAGETVSSANVISKQVFEKLPKIRGFFAILVLFDWAVSPNSISHSHGRE